MSDKMEKARREPGFLHLGSGLASAAEHAAHHAADDAADEGRARIGAAAAVGCRRAALGGAAGGLLAFFARSRGGRNDLGEQRLVLELVEVAGRRIAAGSLPAL